MHVPFPTPFRHLNKDCIPIADKSLILMKSFILISYSLIHQVFSKRLKIYQRRNKRFRDEKIIEPSKSPWRAQVLVLTNKNNSKRHMVIDYSKTINWFTYLGAYPLPQIDSIVSELATYSMFSTIDLKSAYHQVKLHFQDDLYAAFQ